MQSTSRANHVWNCIRQYKYATFIGLDGGEEMILLDRDSIFGMLSFINEYEKFCKDFNGDDMWKDFLSNHDLRSITFSVLRMEE